MHEKASILERPFGKCKVYSPGLGKKIILIFRSISMGLNIILTCLIVGRLLYMRYREKILDPRNSANYMSVASILTESAALYSIWALVFLIAYARGSGVQDILFPPLGQVQVCSLRPTHNVTNSYSEPRESPPCSS